MQQARATCLARLGRERAGASFPADNKQLAGAVGKVGLYGGVVVFIGGDMGGFVLVGHGVAIDQLALDGGAAPLGVFVLRPGIGMEQVERRLWLPDLWRLLVRERDGAWHG